MKELSKSQQRRFRVQKDPKHKARQIQRHESAVKYNRKKDKKDKIISPNAQARWSDYNSGYEE